jgi:hypothetical protein
LNPTLTDDAVVDIESAAQFLEERRAGLGQSFLDAVLDELSAIAKRPKSFPRCFAEGSEPLADYRQAIVSRFHYLILFKPTDTGAIVYAVVDARRDPSVIAERLPPTRE